MTPNSSLLQWLATFQLDNQSSIELKDDAYYNLADGYVCAKILNQISPQYFSDKWLEGIKPVPPNGSWRFRVSNLKRILQKIHDYASDLQSPQFRPSAITPDVAVIAQNFDPDQISRLIQLILFCAISSGKKEDYIEKIRNLPTQVKQDIKEAIEELLINNNDTYNQRLNASQAGNDSINSENEVDANTSGQRLNANISQQTVTTPSRSSTYRSALRRDSSQSSTGTRRNESHLDISSQSDNPDETFDEVRRRLNEALIVKDEKAQACHELELKLKQLQLEKDQLAYENEKLVNEKNSTKVSQSPRRLSESLRVGQVGRDSGTIGCRNVDNRLKNLDDDSSQSLILQQNKKLQSELQKLKEDMMRIETEKEDYRLKSSLLKDDLNKVTLKHDELLNKAEQAKRLQDELDEHKQIVEKFVSTETMIENLKKKNNELKRERKSFEEKNLDHIHKIVELEEENSQLKSTLNRAEIYKKQLQESQVKLSQETHRADKAEVEVTRLLEKYAAAKKENERLYETTNQLMRTSSISTLPKDKARLSSASDNNSQEDPARASTQPGIPIKISSNKTLFEENIETQQQANDALDSMSTSVIELKERVARLEYENELLQTKLNSKRENDQTVLGGLLESANARCTKMEIENRQSRKRILLLEGRLKDLMNTPNGASSSSALFNDSSSDNALALMNRVEELQRLLFQKEQELTESEAKYKKSIQKAKDLIRSLNTNPPINNSVHQSCMSSTSSFNSSSLDETNLLKQQLREREERLIEMEREFFEFKKFKEIHERLIISAFYGLTTPMQWKNAEKRLERSTLTSPPNTANSSMNHAKHSH